MSLLLIFISDLNRIQVLKRHLILLGFLVIFLSCTEKKNSSELKPLLIEQMKYSHSDENWFVPIKTAIAGLTAEQANWKDSTENHSIAELVSHLTFWNNGFLKDLNGEEFSDYDIENDKTFESQKRKVVA